MLRTRLLAVTMAGALVLAACGSDSDGDAAATTTTAATSTTAGEATTTTTGADGATTTTEASEDGATTTTESDEGRDTETSELDTLPDGFHYGYLAGLEEGVVEGQQVSVIIFDKAELLTGEEAAAAATAAGDESPPPNDYYIVNENQTVRRLAVVPDASVTTLDGGSPDPVPSSVTDVAMAGDDILYKILVGNVRGITTVSSIEGVYLP